MMEAIIAMYFIMELQFLLAQAGSEYHIEISR